MFPQIQARGFAAITALGCLLTASPAMSQGDSSIVRLIVPFTAGGGTDSLARAMSRQLQTDLGQVVVVENRPGAGGNIALDMVAAAVPDGKTLVITTNSLVINPLVDAKTRYDAQKSFAPVALLAHSPVVIIGRPDLPFQDLPTLIKYAKSHPGKLSYGSCGTGSIHQLAGEQLKAMAGIDLLHVPYKGCASAMNDLAGGQTDIGINSLTSAATFLGTGKVKLLAVTNSTRSKLIPDVPTVASYGVKNYSFDGWYAVLAPAGTPSAIVKRINASLNKSLGDEAVKKVLTTQQLEPIGGPPSALAEQIAKESAYYAPIVRAAKIVAN